MTDLSQQELLRYARHLVMPEVTAEGQQKLKQARVLCVGAGGLGSPVSLYLAAAGVGTLGLVEFDEVDLSNIQRQILYSTADVGRPKIDAAQERISALNTEINVVPHAFRLSSENVMEVVANYDIVVDGSDNFPTRYLVNDACVLSGKPNVYGSIFRFEGQVAVFDAQRGPCYRCLFPEPPPAGAVPSCAEGGVLGVLPGIIGSLQALETIKLILGKGESLVGKLVLFDALNFDWQKVRISKDPDCAVCGATPSVTAPIDYDAFCQGPAPATKLPFMAVRQLAALLESNTEVAVLDVRNPYEFDIASIPDSVLIPLPELQARLDELDPSRRYVVTCHHGPRSVDAYYLLRAAGFARLDILDGGLDAWSVDVDPSVPRYG